MLRKVVLLLSILLVSALALAARTWNLHEVFVQGRIYFLDGDCYSRMTRVKALTAGEGWSIRHHDFENFPDGTAPHTTMPMDLVIAAVQMPVRGVLNLIDPEHRSVLSGQSLDVAGAIAGPLLGMLACGILLALPGRRGAVMAGAAFLAVSPIAVHGTLLGRPDHQALLIALLAVALVAEWRLFDAESRTWAATAGAAWGLAWWVSLYEPLILFLLVLVALAVSKCHCFASRVRWAEWGLMAGIWLLSVALDGWRLGWPVGVTQADLARWGGTIFELNSLSLLSPALWQWLGLGAVVVPVALGMQWQQKPHCRFALLLYVAVLGLTLWQLRWGYFLAIVFACCLPLAFEAVPRRWVPWAAYAVALWPTAGAWDAQLFPSEAEERRRFALRGEQVALRWIAEQQREVQAGPFLAPWWLTPALAYWSGQPGVAGTSHQSLPGTLDSARVYLAADAGVAMPILQRRGVSWILADDPDRVIANSIVLLGVPPPSHCLAQDLVTPALPAPHTLALIPDRNIKQPPAGEFFHVWKVRREASPGKGEHP